MESPTSSTVIIFDGVCNLCNAWVDFVIRHDKQDRFAFSANQYEAGRKLLASFGEDPDEVETVYVVENGTLYRKSSAALRILKGLGGGFQLLYVFVIIPRPIRDAIYEVIARNRYRWFGQKSTCRIPTPTERTKFLV